VTGKEQCWPSFWGVPSPAENTRVWNWPCSSGSELGSGVLFTRCHVEGEILGQGDRNLLQAASAEKYLGYFKEIFTVSKYCCEVEVSHWIMASGKNSLTDFFLKLLLFIPQTCSWFVEESKSSHFSLLQVQM